MLSGQAYENPWILRFPRWLRPFFGWMRPMRLRKRCGNCGAEMLLADERLWEVTTNGVYGVRAWDCERCEYQTEQLFMDIWATDL